MWYCVGRGVWGVGPTYIVLGRVAFHGCQPRSAVTASQMAGDQASNNGRSRKQTQRIPVRMKILDPPEKIAPGMLVEVNIQIYDHIRF